MGLEVHGTSESGGIVAPDAPMWLHHCPGHFCQHKPGGGNVPALFKLCISPIMITSTD